MNRNKELLKNTAILMVGQFVPKIMALIVLPILTGSLTKTEYGLYDLTLTVASFCIPLVSVQIQQAVFRYLIEKDSKRASIISSSFIFLIFMSSIASVVIIGGWLYYTKDIILSILFMLSYVFEMVLSWGGQVARGLGHNINYSLSYALYSVCFVIVLLIKYIFFGKLELEYVIVSMIISYGVSIAYLFYSCRIIYFVNVSEFCKKTVMKLLAFSGPMVISSVGLWIVNLSDRFCVSGFLGVEMNAVYAVANKIPNLINAFYSVFNLAWTENTSRLTTEEKKKGYYSSFFEEFYALLIGALLLLITVSPVLFKVLIDDQYNAAYGLMSWLYIGVLFSSLVSFFGSIDVGEKKTKEVGISSLLGAVINLLINIVLMKKYGVIVAAVSTILSYFVILLYRAIDIKKYVNIHYNSIKILIGFCTVIILAVLNNHFSIIRTIISVIIVIVYNYKYNFYILKRLIDKIVRRRSI